MSQNEGFYHIILSHITAGVLKMRNQDEAVNKV